MFFTGDIPLRAVPHQAAVRAATYDVSHERKNNDLPSRLLPCSLRRRRHRARLTRCSRLRHSHSKPSHAHGKPGTAAQPSRARKRDCSSGRPAVHGGSAAVVRWSLELAKHAAQRFANGAGHAFVCESGRTLFRCHSNVPRVRKDRVVVGSQRCGPNQDRRKKRCSRQLFRRRTGEHQPEHRNGLHRRSVTEAGPV